ncbi:MAG TPA: sensor histidine kinase [Terriglobales bacterium]|nr:sensor histidine kinase [Terriglobales bacterium]
MVNLKTIDDWVRHRTRIDTARLCLCGSIAVLLYLCSLLGGCQASPTENLATGPTVEFTHVPTAARRDVMGDPGRVSTIKGKVIGARPGQQIVLYAHALDENGQMTWFVQPLALEPFTRIRANSTWRNTTHPGSEYAALLVNSGFKPPLRALSLPTDGVVVLARTQAWPPVWQSWWFPLVCVAIAATLTFALYHVWAFQVTRKLNLRFEERLAERTRVAQELHDTLLQGVLSASMQLHVAVDQLPESSPVRPALNRVLELMGHVVDEGRNTLRGLRPSIDKPQDLKNSLSRVPEELGMQEGVDFRVVVEGSSMPLRSVVRDDVYSIGREALVNAFRHSQAKRIDVELDYAPGQLRVLVRDDGCGIDTQVLESGRDGHWGLSGMRERAIRIGARLKVMSRAGAGTEVELRVPGDIAFGSASPVSASKWLTGPYHWHGRRNDRASERQEG